VVFLVLASSTANPTTSSNKKVRAKSIISCGKCIANGYGWCPIRRKCGGFLNRKCRGDNTDKAVAAVHPVRENLEEILSTSQKHSMLLLYRNVEGAERGREKFQSLAHELKSMRELICLELNCTERAEYCKSNGMVFARSGFLVRLFKEGQTEYGDAVDLGENYDVDTILHHLKRFRGELLTVEKLASEFTREVFMREGEGMNKDGNEIMQEVGNILNSKREESPNENYDYLGKRYIYWMKRFLEGEKKDVGILSQALNAANLAVGEAGSREDYTNARHEIDVLRAFVKPLFRL